MGAIYLLLFILLLAALSCYSFFCKRKLRMELLQKCGIPGPTPNFITGHLIKYISMGNLAFHTWLINRCINVELQGDKYVLSPPFSRNHNIYTQTQYIVGKIQDSRFFYSQAKAQQETSRHQLKWELSYGPIVGYYLGAEPYILVADEDLLQKIQITDASIFLERPRRIPNGINPDPKRKNMLAHLEVDKWKKMRKVLSPSFSSAKLKAILPQIEQLIDQLLDNITKSAARADHDIEIGILFQRFALDVVGGAVFGQYYGLLNHPNHPHPLLKAVQTKFDRMNSIDSLPVKLSLCFPEIFTFLQPIRVVCQYLKDWLGFGGSLVWTTAWDAIRQRQRNGTAGHHTDQLQILLDGQIESDQIAAYCVHTLEGGYETLSSMLGFITHLLAKYPDVQRRVREECQRSRSEEVEVTHELLSQLKYMDALIAEALRLWPQITFIRRTPSEDYGFTDKDGKRYIFPAQVQIQIAHFQIHRSENIYKNPMEFNLDRFYGGGKIPVDDPKFQGFGCGYRHCMGYNLALLILKFTIFGFLRKFKVSDCSNSSGANNGAFDEFGDSTADPTKPIYVRVEPI